MRKIHPLVRHLEPMIPWIVKQCGVLENKEEKEKADGRRPLNVIRVLKPQEAAFSKGRRPLGKGVGQVWRAHVTL